jgi:hypothetical protein
LTRIVPPVSFFFNDTATTEIYTDGALHEAEEAWTATGTV